MQTDGSTVPNIIVNYPLVPGELLRMIQVTINGLLARDVYQVLLQDLASGDQEILVYLLGRTMHFRDAVPEGHTLNWDKWPASTVMRLLEENWSLFSDSASARVPYPSQNEPFLADKTGNSSATVSNSSSTSRWAKAPPTSRFSRQSDARSAHLSDAAIESSATRNKLLRLAEALASPPEEGERWSNPRWTSFLDDLRSILLDTGLLRTSDRKEWVHRHDVCWQENVRWWRHVQEQSKPATGQEMQLG